MKEDCPPRQSASVWNRFWSPRAYVETFPVDAPPEEMSEVNSRNARWLKAHMDIYILRWGVLWAATVMLAIFASGDDTPGLLFPLALAATMLSSLGLGAMLYIYRRAWKTLQRTESE